MKIVEMNAHSVKQTDPQKLGNIDIQPHYVSLYYIPVIFLYLRKSSFRRFVNQMFGEISIQNVSLPCYLLFTILCLFVFVIIKHICYS